MADGINARTPCMNWGSGDLPGTWKAFKTHCEFMFQGPLKKKQGDEKCAYLMIWVGEKGRNVYSTWDMSAEDQKKLDKYYENFEAYVKPKSNQVFSSYKFQCRLQKTNETCEEFVTDLKVLVKDCQYANPDRMVRDRIVFGTKSSEVREKLINEGSELTLEKALDIARTYELSQRQLQTMNIGEDPNVNSINRKNIYSKQTPKKVIRTNMNKRCGYDHKAGSYCPAKGKQCKKCDKKDHFAKMCKTRKEKKVHEIDREECSNYYDSSDSDTLFVGALYNEKNESDTWCEDITVENVNLFTGLGCLPGIHKIHVDDSSTPVVHPPRKVPVSLKGRIKTELDRMLKLGVIVRQKEPTAWVNSMVTVVKSNGDVRICIDPKDLNKAISREHYPMKTVEEVVANIPNAKVFSKIDATSGFWHLKLDEDSSKLTCFNTPFGRYRFLRAPFGIKSIPEIFQRVMTEIMENIEGAEVIVDDILIWGSTIQTHDERLQKVLDRARQCKLKLSKSKCQFRKK
ncbi:unnamed protein product [Mytilus coruscus]|uniref:Reverse transcriptase domain-containing protein n=1 Tax=Mytilus coruscus TaxID=42192 RepID=A0A6J8ACY8_MYTCO|nr:unnamed protein product [Mytilus coruscus]